MTADELRAWRIARDLTQAEVADRIGIHPRQLGRWEAGDARIPRLMEIYTKEH